MILAYRDSQFQSFVSPVKGRRWCEPAVWSSGSQPFVYFIPPITLPKELAWPKHYCDLTQGTGPQLASFPAVTSQWGWWQWSPGRRSPWKPRTPELQLPPLLINSGKEPRQLSSEKGHRQPQPTQLLRHGWPPDQQWEKAHDAQEDYRGGERRHGHGTSPTSRNGTHTNNRSEETNDPIQQHKATSYVENIVTGAFTMLRLTSYYCQKIFKSRKLFAVPVSFQNICLL